MAENLDDSYEGTDTPTSGEQNYDQDTAPEQSAAYGQDTTYESDTAFTGQDTASAGQDTASAGQASAYEDAASDQGAAYGQGTAYGQDTSYGQDTASAGQDTAPIPPTSAYQPAYSTETSFQTPYSSPASSYTSSASSTASDYTRPASNYASSASSYTSPASSTSPMPAYDYAAASDSAQAAQASQPRAKSSAGRTFLVAFLGALVACIIVFAIAGLLGLFTSGSSSSEGTQESSSTLLGSQSGTTFEVVGESTTLAEAVAAKVLPSVVNIDVYTNESYYGYGYGFGYGYGYDDNSGELTQSSLGSGVVLTSDGYIITNYHVVEDSEALKVTVEGEEYDADVVGYDASSDIAVVKVNGGSGFTPIEIGDSDDLVIGEWVMSIGSPFGLEQSVATGIVSATSRSRILSDSTYSGGTIIYPNMIQTDAAINPGNSGGALVDANGKLIGINTLITSYSGSYSGVGFAIPVNYAISIAEQIIDGKTPTHAQLGVSMTTIDSSMAKRYGFNVDSGAYVSAVVEGSGAAQAGIEVGDIITAFDGQKVESSTDLMIDVRSKNPGDVVTVTFNRDGETFDVEVTLGSDGAEEEEEESESSSQGGSSLLDRLRNLEEQNSGNES